MPTNVENEPKTNLVNLALLPVELKIIVGCTRPLIKDLMEIEENTVLPLDRDLNDLVDLFVEDKLLARGQLEEINDGPVMKLGVRITEVID